MSTHHCALYLVFCLALSTFQRIVVYVISFCHHNLIQETRTGDIFFSFIPIQAHARFSSSSGVDRPEAQPSLLGKVTFYLGWLCKLQWGVSYIGYLMSFLHIYVKLCNELPL